MSLLKGVAWEMRAGRSRRESAQTVNHSPVKSDWNVVVSGCIRHAFRTFLAGLVTTALAGSAAQATEVGLFAGPLGGADMRSAYLPPEPGLYGAAIGIVGSYNVLRDNNGNSNSIDAYYDAALGGVAGTYVYPWTLGGGRLASTISQGYLYTNERIGGRRQRNSGFSDTYSDILVWSRYLGRFDGDEAPSPDGPKLPYGLTFSGAYSMVVPDGRYNVRNLATQGHNYYVFIPNFALTYLTDPSFSFGNGTEFSARFFYDMPSKNTADEYRSGQVFDVDWAVTERFTGLQAGITGNYAHQTTPDRSHGLIAAPDGNYLERATFGPIVALDVPSIGSTVKAKILWDYYDRNTFGDRIAATITLTFKIF